MVTVTLSAALVHTVLGVLGARYTSLHVLEVGDTTWPGVGGNRLRPIYVRGTAMDILDTRGTSERIVDMSIFISGASSEVM